MNIGIIGTGMVGQTIAARLSELGHAVVIGTRNVSETLARSKPDGYGNPPFSVWLKGHPKVNLSTFAGAATHGEILMNATNGAASLDALRSVGEKNLEGKILLDISNPLDFSRGMPPSLLVCNTDSLGEQIQRTFPTTHVVKTLNTVNALVMVNPALVADGDHHLFMSGNDEGAKKRTAELLQSWFGWKHILDLGDITTARGTEMLLPLWVRLWGVMKTPMFNFKVAR